jgi:hypothetical protein
MVEPEETGHARRNVILGVAAAAAAVVLAKLDPDIGAPSPRAASTLDAVALDADGRIPTDELPLNALNDSIETNAILAGVQRVSSSQATNEIALRNTRLINASLRDLAATGGGRVRLPGGEGDFVIADTIFLPSNTALVGDGALHTRVRLMDGADLAKVPSSQLVKTTGQSNVRIWGIGFDGGDQIGDTLSVTLDGANNVWIEDCSFRNLKRAISVLNASESPDTVPHHIYIRDNQFLDGIQDFAVRIVDNNESPDPHDIWISGNTVESVKNVIAKGETSAFRIAGIRVHVNNNLVSSSDDTGIMFAGNCEDCVATGNTITSTYVGIFCGSGSRRVKIADNSCTSVEDHGIHAYNPDKYSGELFTTITGNVLYDCGKTGIHIEGGFGVTVTGNHIVNPGSKFSDGTANREASGLLIGNSYPDGTNVSGMIVVTGNVIVDNREKRLMQVGIHAESASTGDRASVGLVFWPNAISGATRTSMLLPSSPPDPAKTGIGSFWVLAANNRPCWSDGTTWRFADGTPAA